MRNVSDNEISGYFSGSAKVTIASTIAVTIDIKPGSYPNSINLKSGQSVAVGIFSTEDFDARTIDPETVTLAGAAVKTQGKGDSLMWSFKDLNGDGLLDLVLHFDAKDLNLTETDENAVLNGNTFDGIPITGSDSVKIGK